MTSPRGAVRAAMQHRASAAPPSSDIEATVRWLRDREIVKDLYARYAYGVDSLDIDLVRSVFHHDCVVVGTMEQGTLDDYLLGLEEGLLMYATTMHFRGNPYDTGPFPRPFVGPPPYPRPKHQSEAGKALGS